MRTTSQKLLAIGLMALPSLALAQADISVDASASVEKKRSSNRMLEEVVVTAQKREEDTQDIPIAIQAFGSGQLGAKNILSTEDLGPMVPSLRFTQAAGYTLIYLRGVGTSQFVPSADPSIATYVDGVYMPTGQAGTKALGNVERVEVLKGPQGTLYGRNTIGGAINVITKKPGAEFEASANAQYTDLHQKSGGLSVAGPLTDWLSAGVALGYEREESYVALSNFNDPKTESKIGRVQFVLTPTDRLTMELTGYYQGQQNKTLSIGQNVEPKPLGTLTGVTPQGDDFTVDNDLPPRSEANQRLVYGGLTWELDSFDFKVLASDQEVNIPRYDYDFDGSPLPLIGFDTSGDFSGLPAEYTTLESLELQFLSNPGSWRSDQFEWVAGLYAFHSVGAFDPARFHVAPDLLGGVLDLGGITLPTVLNDLLGSLGLDNTPLGEQGVSLSLSGVLETDSYSAYFQGTYSITQWLDITLGGRFQTEDRYLTKSETNVYNPIGVNVPVLGPLIGGGLIPLLKFPLKGEEDSVFTPKAQVTIRPTDASMFYASYGQGYKSGTYNIVAIYSEPDYINPELVTSYEIGSKTDFFDGDFRLNTAIFYNEIEDLQDGFVSLLSGGAVSFNTAKAARTQGFEFDFQWVPMAEWNPGLVITGNFAYVNAIYTDFKNGEGFREDNGIYQSNLDLSGFRLRNTPERSGSIGFVQAIDFEDSTVELGADIYHSSRFFYNANNTVSEDPYNLVSARVSYEYLPWQTRLTVFGSNLLDERYHVQQFETDFGVLKTLAPPRSIGARVNWEF